MSVYVNCDTGILARVAALHAELVAMKVDNENCILGKRPPSFGRCYFLNKANENRALIGDDARAYGIGECWKCGDQFCRARPIRECANEEEMVSVALANLKGEKVE